MRSTIAISIVGVLALVACSTSQQGPKSVQFSLDFTQEPDDNNYFDIDTGIKGKNGGADFFLSGGCGSDCFSSLVSKNGAYGVGITDTENCAEVLSSEEPGGHQLGFGPNGILGGNGLHACLYSSEGHFYHLVISDIERAGTIDTWTLEYWLEDEIE